MNKELILSTFYSDRQWALRDGSVEWLDGLPAPSNAELLDRWNQIKDSEPKQILIKQIKEIARTKAFEALQDEFEETILYLCAQNYLVLKILKDGAQSLSATEISLLNAASSQFEKIKQIFVYSKQLIADVNQGLPVDITNWPQ